LSESTWFLGQPRVSTQKVRGTASGYRQATEHPDDPGDAELTSPTSPN
jgi:hypothetical protein